MPFEETLGEIDRLYKEGKFAAWGLSNFAAFEVAEIVMICRERGWVRPRVYQGCYNAISKFGGGCLELDWSEVKPGGVEDTMGMRELTCATQRGRSKLNSYPCADGMDWML